GGRQRSAVTSGRAKPSMWPLSALPAPTPIKTRWTTRRWSPPSPPDASPRRPIPEGRQRSVIGEAGPYRVGGDLGPARHAELGEDVRDVDRGGPRRDEQSSPELAVG